MLHHFPDATAPKSFRTTTIASIAALALAIVCGIGIAAFTGLLPQSEEVAVKMTTTPLIDIWRSDDTLSGARSERETSVLPD